MADESLDGTEPELRRTRLADNRVSRLLWTVAGTFSLAIGVIGIVIPLLPTTPFLLLSAACYFRGSPRIYRWLLTNRYFGTYLKNYREGKGVPLKVKIGTLLLLWIVLGLSAAIFTENLAVRIVLVLVGLGVSIHILMIRGERSIPGGETKSSGTDEAIQTGAPSIHDRP